MGDKSFTTLSTLAEIFNILRLKRYKQTIKAIFFQGLNRLPSAYGIRITIGRRHFCLLSNKFLTMIQSQLFIRVGPSVISNLSSQPSSTEHDYIFLNVKWITQRVHRAVRTRIKKFKVNNNK